MARRRTDSRATRRIEETAFVLLVLLGAAGCRLESESRVAERILERYRAASGARPLARSHVIRMSLSPDAAAGAPSATGVAEVAWRDDRYRERTASAGAITERGIQGGKAYYVDEDGFTRVVSEPVLAELLSRSYFWRRAWLFADRERARLSVGPADASTVSIRLAPTGGAFPLTLSFSRRDGALVAVRSPRFDLDFESPTRFRETSGRRPPVRGEITWVGLPTGPMADAAVGGGCGVFQGVPAPLAFTRTPGGGIAFPAAVNGNPVALALDSEADGPLRVSPAVAARLGLEFATDVFGRRLASGARLDAGGFSCEGIHVEALASAPEGADGVVGGTLFREAVVEIDPRASRVALHEPNRFVPPEGFTRVLVDDDGNRPVTILRRGANDVRLRMASPTGGAHIRLAAEAAARAGIELPATVRGFRWGGVALPELSAVREPSAPSPGWGDDGTLGFPALMRFHVFVDMTYRWVYVRPTER
ncbi:MAG TPA: hypothetical protein VFF17_11355 [Thermoanaerobaculia bacterium]|nr:hypothetical protein [Thermoanaerobaculia bacterium]